MILSSLQGLVNQAKIIVSPRFIESSSKNKADSFRFWEHFPIQAMIIIDKFTKKNDECVW